MYTPQQRAMLEATLYNLRHYKDCIGEGAEIWGEIKRMSDAELESIINDYLQEV